MVDIGLWDENYYAKSSRALEIHRNILSAGGVSTKIQSVILLVEKNYRSGKSVEYYAEDTLNSSPIT